ncbi:MAG: septal ring lytic transglycosylase RlpA family protein [Solirubrobacteraceae bacterium]
MLRPHIKGRVLRAQPALLGASLTCAAALTVIPVGSVADATVPSVPGSIPLPGIPATPVGTSVAQLIDPVLPLPPAQVKLRIHRIDLDVLDGSSAIVAGALRPGLPGRTVDLQRLGRHGWRTISQSFTRPRGRFVLRYTPRRLLTERVRVLFAGDPRDLRAQRNVGRLSSYRLAGASWYGGGGSLACGGQLTGSTLGVANKTLPCGTLVTLRYGGHSVRVPVVDRGPYVAGREFDLTEATKRALGFEGVGEVWSTR